MVKRIATFVLVTYGVLRVLVGAIVIAIGVTFATQPMPFAHASPTQSWIAAAAGLGACVVGVLTLVMVTRGKRALVRAHAALSIAMHGALLFAALPVRSYFVSSIAVVGVVVELWAASRWASSSAGG